MYLVCQPRSKGYPYGKLYTWLLAHTSVLVLIINSKQCKKKKKKLTRFVAQIDWKISQVEAVQFYCRTATCKSKVNYFNCVSHDNNNQSKNSHHCLFQFLSYLLIAIVLTSVCTGNFTCVHGKLVISLENGTMLQTLFCFLKKSVFFSHFFYAFQAFWRQVDNHMQ